MRSTCQKFGKLIVVLELQQTAQDARRQVLYGALGLIYERDAQPDVPFG